MKIPRHILILIFIFCLVVGHTQSNQNLLESIKTNVSDSLLDHSIQQLSDVYGPRFMGTPNYYEAALWAKQELEDYGMDTVYFSNFDDAHRGWSAEGHQVKVVSPVQFQLNVVPHAFTASSNRTEKGELLLVSNIEEVLGMTKELKGKILLFTRDYRQVTNQFEPFATRLSDQTLLGAKANQDPNDVIIGYHSRRSTKTVFRFRREQKQRLSRFLSHCKAQGVIAILEPSTLPYGILHADGNSIVPSLSKKIDILAVPTFVVANEHFGRLKRLVEMGKQPFITIALSTKIYENPKYNVNLIAEIKGSDPKLKEELVIIGAHLDSCHAGTGAVDNAANCAVLMEAMRLLKSSGLKPRRTIRLIFWGGEEQVFAGSANYTDERLGTNEVYFIKPPSGLLKNEKGKISTYLNLDNGAGKIRGVYLNGNTAVESYFANYLQPFPTSQTLTVQNVNQSDHELLDYCNIPSFQLIQDPLDYISAVHHTNLDAYEYVPLQDQAYNTQVIAYLAYRAAMEDHLLPRRPYHSTIPSTSGNENFTLKGHKNAQEVFLIGDFNNWSMFGTPMYRTDTGWETKIDLPRGRYFYKFIIDGQWTADPKTPENKIVKDGKGHGGLTVRKVD